LSEDQIAAIERCADPGLLFGVLLRRLLHRIDVHRLDVLKLPNNNRTYSWLGSLCRRVPNGVLAVDEPPPE
jgi:hypothetical protein